ncbi:MAG: serine/threonine-protein phosphatase, partial [Clostridia bacterium]|nr:serine/threonine-protein phosphatase [Clostridia bacterium]
LTKDHSIVQNMIDRGEITREEARTHPNRNILEKAVGVNSDVTCDYSCIALRAEDQLLLCTDGLTNFVSEAAIAEIMQRFSPEKTPVELVNAANNNGGGDNITAVIVKVEE